MDNRNFQTNVVFALDCREVLRGMNSNSVDLIATDRPFNTDRARQFKGGQYIDIWRWGKEVHEDWLDEIEATHPHVWRYIMSIRKRDHPACHKTQTSSDANLSAFLCFCADTLIQEHRVLKPTGAICEHLDQTAGHYFNVLMDMIFGNKNFRNEIVWHYGLGAFSAKNHLPKKHDKIFWYTKSMDYTFNVLRGDPTDAMLKKYCHEDSEGRYMISYGKKYYMKGGKPFDSVWEIASLAPTDSHRTGYRDQKPPKLYERLVAAFSNPGDLVLDPFCGCGTTLKAAKTLGREWVGCDNNETAKPKILALFAGKKKKDMQRMFPSVIDDHLKNEGVQFVDTCPVRTDDEVEETEKVVPKLGPIYYRPTTKPLFSRDAIKALLLGRCGKVCWGCGDKFVDGVRDGAEHAQVDHINPDETLNLTNAAILCGACNRQKGNSLTLAGLRKALFGSRASKHPKELVNLKEASAWAHDKERDEVDRRKRDNPNLHLHL